MACLKTASVLAGMVVSSTAGGQVLVSQPNDRPSEPSFFSDAVPGQFFSQRVADNFSISDESNVTAVRFWGGSQNFQFSDLTNMESWTVRIFADDGAGGVDESAEVFAGEFSIGSARGDGVGGSMTVTPTGDLNLTQGDVFEHVISLDSALTLSAGSYWLSVGATLVNPGADGWVWAGSTVGDLVNATDFFDGNGFQTFDPTFNDLAFEIEGSVVPAPGVGVLLGASGLLVARRRR